MQIAVKYVFRSIGTTPKSHAFLLHARNWQISTIQENLFLLFWVMPMICWTFSSIVLTLEKRLLCCNLCQFFAKSLQCRSHIRRLIFAHLQFPNGTCCIQNRKEVEWLITHFVDNFYFKLETKNGCSSILLNISLYCFTCRPRISREHAVTSCYELKNYSTIDPCEPHG